MTSKIIFFSGLKRKFPAKIFVFIYDNVKIFVFIYDPNAVFQPLLLNIFSSFIDDFHIEHFQRYCTKYFPQNFRESHRISVKVLQYDWFKFVQYSWKLLLHFIPSLASSSFGEISLFEVCGKTAAALFVELTDVEKESVAAIRAAKSFFSDILAWKWPTWKKGWQKTS